ncbi:hypothetical protein QTP70_011017 [Hemibagrus guttatus]|uniref:ribonuclease H n=1 Tax=Hemibagrus guttatus TaxID=175788 RepID=A0AAE0PRD1_9TELE|nr:hypothetical protein QTP70_011017 [Hemibagrus guttatus]
MAVPHRKPVPLPRKISPSATATPTPAGAEVSSAAASPLAPLLTSPCQVLLFRLDFWAHMKLERNSAPTDYVISTPDRNRKTRTCHARISSPGSDSGSPVVPVLAYSADANVTPSEYSPEADGLHLVCIYVNKQVNTGPNLDRQKVMQLPDHLGPARPSVVLQQAVQGCIDSAYQQKTVFTLLTQGYGGEKISATFDGKQHLLSLPVVNSVGYVLRFLKKLCRSLLCENLFSDQPIAPSSSPSSSSSAHTDKHSDGQSKSNSIVDDYHSESVESKRYSVDHSDTAFGAMTSSYIASKSTYGFRSGAAYSSGGVCRPAASPSSFQEGNRSAYSPSPEAGESKPPPSKDPSRWSVEEVVWFIKDADPQALGPHVELFRKHGAGGNWATVGRRSRGGRRVRRQREKRKGKSVGLRIGTLNVGTMTGKGRELADVMERRKVDILCVQETRWKGSKARSIGAGFKLLYYGVDSKRNGVGVVLKEEFVRNVLEVKRVSDRVMSLKLEIEGVMLNVVRGYAPQVGCELEEKERFWSELDEVMESIPTGERVVIGADFNGHVGEGNRGDEGVMGKFGVKERNLEGQMVVDFAKRMDMGVVNTYFQKREEHRVTYKSGGRRTQVDYILCRRGNLKEISDCKVVVGESVARQHRMVVCRMILMVCKKKRSKIEKKTKWWKLKKEECCEEFRQKLRQALGGQVVLPDDWETTAEVIRETGRKVLGVSSGKRKEDKETWWWNEEVQDSIQRKRLAKKKWDMDRTEENRQEYKELQRRVKREVSKAKQKAYDELYTRLDTREGEKDLYRLARQRDQDGKDVQQVRVIKDRDGRVLTSEESVQRRWKEYFEELMNEENEREKRVEGVNSVEQKVEKIRKDEVRKALKRMKSGKAVGPDDIPVEVWKCLGEAAVEFLTSLFNRVLESERMPEEWRSVLVPIFKNKGDVQSCSNYRGIKLMSHTMKLWERVVEARLRKVVEICEQQYGFMPRKSTTDAIFVLRILTEKYRDGQRDSGEVCCRSDRGVQSGGGTASGIGSEPLFAIVMDQLSEEVRQESPWTMMFADDIVICSESREQVEENLERWRFALERRGMKVSRSKTEYMCVNEREGSGTVRLQGEEVKKVQEFKYLGSTVQSNGECGKEVKKRVQAGWNGWRKVSGVLCDRKISARIKGKVYRTVVRAAMLYGLETVSLRKRQESELEVAELKMLRFSLGVTRLDRIRNEYIRGTAHVGRLGDKVREARLRWFGHVQRRESEYIGRRMLDMELPGRRQRGRPKRRHFLQLFRRDPEAFPGQPRDIVSPACPGSYPSSLPGGACPEHLPRETSWRHPKQMPEPPQLSPFDVEKQWLYSELLPGDRAPYPISKGAPRHPTEEAHFGRLYPGSYPFGHDPELMTIARINREGCVRKGIRRKTLPNLTMRIVSTNFIPDRSRPGLTTTAIGAVDLQGAGGNWATVGRRSRGGRRVRRQREKRKGKSVGLRIGTLNVGTMTGKGRELADVMERRKVDILCVQETRWKGSKARSIGAGFKLFYYGVDSKRNGVGVVLKEEFVRNVLEVKRVSDRVMSLKLEIEGVMLNVVSGYAPQVGCELEEKERFWSELDEVMESIPTGERVVIGADFNGHVGEGNTGDEEVMGRFGVKERNLEGQMVVDFAKRMDMGVVNTYFQKREEHRVTYKSGGRSTQVDYILCRRGNLKEISDCKVVVGESVARQHRMVVCRMTLMVCKKKRSEIEKKTKWWKLKKEECCEEFRQKLRQALGGQVVLPDDWETTAEVIRETGKKVLGVSSGRRKEDKETWWWNEEVQDSIQRKRLAKKKWDMDRTEENRQEYKELQHRVKREVSKAKQKAYDELYTRLDTREGEKDLYRLGRQRDRDGKDVQQVRVIKDRDGRMLTSEESIQRRWKEYFEELMNEENEREKRVEGVNSVEQKVDKIRKDEVRKALKRMKSGKAVGPDDIPVEVWKCLGEAAVEFLASLFNRVLESERMPEEWRRSVLVPIFKNKGDVQSCSNYRGIKLMSHTMKLWERVVEARLRKVVEICEQQYGFMPRKSTTDAIFALRILMEKYRDGQRELHCVFVDLEKVYDRVPREELWYCMRKSGVAEKYVRVVQDMYERSRTVVRCAVGQTEEFNVEVGLHQGSALSPFLFAIVMDQLSEEVRQESPWTMMFADDIVICSESREQVEENLERWRFALERRGMKVSRSKTEYMCVNEREGSGTVRLQGEEVKKVQEFKYLGSTVQSNGERGKEVKKRVQAGWNGWRKVSGVLCDRKISARIKGKVYRTVVRPAMLYGLETVSLRKRQESELEVAELKMLRFSLGVTRLDRIRNEYIRGTAHVGRLGDKVREARLRWFGHVQRREIDIPKNKINTYRRELRKDADELKSREKQNVGCELEEKERFWSELDEVMESIPTGERVVIGADFNGHVGEGNTGDEEVMGKFGVKERNLEGQMVVDFAKRMDMGVVNTYFQKREEHRVTYKSGGRRTQVDYILCRRGNLKEISDCKVVVGESVARQHRMVVCRMTLMVCKTKRSKIEIEKKTKWWKLKKEECCEEFRQKLRQALGGQVVLPDDWETTAEVIRETGRKVLGVSSGRRKEDKETWWWNEEVQDSVQRKRLAKKK